MVVRDPIVTQLLSDFQVRKGAWDALIAPCRQKREAADAVYREINQTTNERKARIDDLGAVARICSDVAGSGKKSLLMRLSQAGFPAELAALYRLNQDMADTLKNPAKNMPECVVLRNTGMLRKFERLLAKGKYDSAMELLDSSEPGRLSRAFSKDRAAAKTTELATLRAYATQHKELRGRFKELEALLPDVEKETSLALCRILKSKEWARLAAGPLPEGFENDPAIAILRKYSAVADEKGFFKARQLRKAIRGDIEDLYLRQGKAVDLKGVETLFRDAEAFEGKELHAMRAKRAAIGHSRKETDILSRRITQGMESELFVTIRGRRVDLVSALEKLQNSNAGDPVERAELLAAAQQVRQGWSDDRLHTLGQGMESGLSHGVFARTGRFLTDSFNVVARAVETTKNAFVRGFEHLRGEPMPHYM